MVQCPLTPMEHNARDILFLRNAKKAFVPPVIVKNEEQKARLKARKVVVLRQIPMHQMLVHGSI